MTETSIYFAYWFKDQLTDFLIDYHKYGPTDTRVTWLTDWLTNASTGLLIQGSTDWLIEWLTQVLAYWFKDQLTDGLINDLKY